MLSSILPKFYPLVRMVNIFNAYKYLPYGPINEVMPYLIRRAQENSDVMSGVTKERKMMCRFFLSHR